LKCDANIPTAFLRKAQQRQYHESSVVWSTLPVITNDCMDECFGHGLEAVDYGGHSPLPSGRLHAALWPWHVRALHGRASSRNSRRSGLTTDRPTVRLIVQRGPVLSSMAVAWNAVALTMNSVQYSAIGSCLRRPVDSAVFLYTIRHCCQRQLHVPLSRVNRYRENCAPSLAKHGVAELVLNERTKHTNPRRVLNTRC